MKVLIVLMKLLQNNKASEKIDKLATENVRKENNKKNNKTKKQNASSKKSNSEINGSEILYLQPGKQS